MKAKIDIDVINGIMNCYTRAGANQTRVYGIIFGTQDKETYHITNAIYGYIFEEQKENGKLKYNRLSTESMNTLLQSFLTHHSNESILGGFVTDVELFPELNSLFSTIGLISSKYFPQKNSLLILVDPFYSNKTSISFGVKAYNWNVNYQFGDKQEDLSVMSFREIPVKVIEKQYLHSILNSKGIDQWKVDLGINEIDLNNNEVIDNLVESLMKLDSVNTSPSSSTEENISYLKTQVNLCEKYLEVVEKYLNTLSEKNFDLSLFNKIDLIVSMLKPLLEKEEIVELMKRDTKQNEIVLNLTNLLSVQIQLTEKINKLNI